MIGTARLGMILLALAAAATPALAHSWHYRHHHYGWYGFHGGNYNYGGPHYSVDDYFNNSRQLDGTR